MVTTSRGSGASKCNCQDRKCQYGIQSMLCVYSRGHAVKSSSGKWYKRTCTCTSFASHSSLWTHLSASPFRQQKPPRVRNHLDLIHVHVSQVHLQWPTLCCSYFILSKRKIVWTSRSLFPQGIHPVTQILSENLFFKHFSRKCNFLTHFLTRSDAWRISQSQSPALLQVNRQNKSMVMSPPAV